MRGGISVVRAESGDGGCPGGDGGEFGGGEEGGHYGGLERVGYGYLEMGVRGR